MKTKRCSKCKEIKPIYKFGKDKRHKDYHTSLCKNCLKEYSKQYYKNNIEKIRESKRKWNKNNSEYMKKYQKNNRERINECSRKQYKNNPEKINARIKKFRSIPQNRLRNRIITAINISLKHNKGDRHWEDLVGYKLQNLIAHLESLFKDGMTWQNMNKWEIDHKRPISSFNFESYEDKEFKECWVLDNLQPLWTYENRHKLNKL